MPIRQIACQASFLPVKRWRGLFPQSIVLLQFVTDIAAKMPAKKPKRPTPVTLRLWRKHMDLTQEQVAEKLGVDTSAVHKWETGKTPVDLEILKMLAKVYEIDRAALLFPPAEGELVEELRQAYDILRCASPELKKHWLAVGKSMAAEAATAVQANPAPANLLPSLTVPKRRKG